MAAKLRITIIIVILALGACGAIPVKAAQRCYYSVADTMVSVVPSASTFVVELRGALPGVREGRGVSADWWGMATADGQWVALQGFNTDYGGLHDRRGLRVIYGCVGRDGLHRESRDSVDLYDGVELLRGYNTLAVEWTSSGIVNVYAGSVEPRKVMSTAAAMPEKEVRIIGEGHRMMETVMTEWTEDRWKSLQRSWTIGELKAHYAETSDPLEGFWSYLDRKIDDDRARIGGKYRVAVVADPESGGYDILYVDGAVTESSRWHPMMLKGYMTPSRYEDVWDVRWLDAMAREMDDEEAYARLSIQEGLLTIEFPLYRSRLRFAKE